jgi:hypothetical protein
MAGAGGAEQARSSVPHGRPRVRVSPPTREGQGSRRSGGGSEHKKAESGQREAGKAGRPTHDYTHGDQRLVCLDHHHTRASSF